MAVWRGEKLVLASQSVIRRAMLENAGIPVEPHPADIDERAIEISAGLQDPTKIALHLASEKALAVASQKPGRIVVGADQTLALGAKRFSKPIDRAAARKQLEMLAGQTHALHSAVAVACDGTITFSHVDTARLTMRKLSPVFLDAYLGAAGDAVTKSVGAYQLEKLGVHLFERIEGDHFTILGLPLLALLHYLRLQGSILA
ncbi:MAG TPA: Maf family protein [Xanthobacteraceae bacterium]|jgi:septum formation protein|nr:Maf family protein [Xanthobacteraceae bacterium]